MDGGSRRYGPQLLDCDDVPAILGSRPSDFIPSEDDDDDMARMSDISNVTLGNRIANLSGV